MHDFNMCDYILQFSDIVLCLNAKVAIVGEVLWYYTLNTSCFNDGYSDMVYEVDISLMM